LSSLSLDGLEVSGCGKVLSVRIGGQGAAAEEAGDLDRLRALGVCEGRHVEVLKGGDPMILRVFGSRLGVGRALAARVVVARCEPAECRGRERNS
jgi:Fe2+ transport system protein FeoA